MVRRGMGRAVALAVGLAGCGPLVLPEGVTETEAESEGDVSTSGPVIPEPPGTTTTPPPPPPPGTTTTSPPTDESTTGVSSVGFLDGFDDGWNPIECDLFLQDCPRGEKCMPWANDGGSSWNALRCSPVDESPDAVGEPCTVEGSGVSGIDSCDYGSMCWDVDPETNTGECVAFCVGSEENPLCEDANTMCAIGGDSVLALCIGRCDPLLQDCGEGDGCYPGTDGFICVLDASGDMGAAGEPCEFINVCDPGTFCASAEVVPACRGAVGCCTPFCDVTVADPLLYCLPGQECVSWWEPGDAPPGYEHVGACSLPM